MIEEALHAELANIPAVQLDGGRKNVYPLRFPDAVDATRPIVTYQEIRSGFTYPNLEMKVFQVSCFAPTMAAARDLADAVRSQIHGRTKFSLGGSKWVEGAFQIGRQSLYDDTAKLWQYVLDMQFKF